MDNIRMDLREMWWEEVDWIHLAQNTDQSRSIVPYNAGNFLTSHVTISFSRETPLHVVIYLPPINQISKVQTAETKFLHGVARNKEFGSPMQYRKQVRVLGFQPKHKNTKLLI
jgi:hypothetical protein